MSVALSHVVQLDKSGSSPLDLLEREHRMLLQLEDSSQSVTLESISRSPNDSNSTGAIREFLQMAVDAGRQIDFPKERQQAQGLIDYWVATLYSMDPAGMRRMELPQTVLASFDQHQVDEQVARVQVKINQLSDEKRKLLSKILLRMVRLDAKTGQFGAEPAPLTSLQLLGSDEAVNHIIIEFEDVGVFRRQTVESTGEPGLGLAKCAFLRQWPFLKDTLDQRRKLSETAAYWNLTRRDPGLLISTNPILEDLQAYHDLNPIEKQYVDESTRALIGSDRRKKRILTCGMVLFALLALVAASLANSRSVALKNETVAKENLEVLNGKMTVQNEELKNTTMKLEDALKEALANEEAAKSNAKFAQQKREEAVTEKAKSDAALASLRDLVEELLDAKAGANVPEQIREKANRLRDRYEQSFKDLSQSNVNTPHEIIGPGIRLQTPDERIWSTSGVFVRKEDGTIGVLTPRFVFGDVGNVKAQIGNVSVTRAELPTGVGPGDDTKSLDLTDLTLGVVNADAPVSNKLPDGTIISDWVRSPFVGQRVYGFGARSGKSREVEIREIQEDGTVAIDRISAPGDAGGPVFTPDGKLVGIIISSNGSDRTFVKPVDKLIKEFDLVILPTK